MQGAKAKWMNHGFWGAAFLMATSAIGPGFITQTTVFTMAQGAAFGFAILASIVVDIVVQLNIWKAIAASRVKAPALANKVLPGAGYLLTGLVVMGGLVFNIGNVAGCGLGLHTATGVNIHTGALMSGLFAVGIFLVKEFGAAMDNLAKWLGILMIAMVLYVAISVEPPLLHIAQQTVWPSQMNTVSILTLVGGTVGGYISFAGAHRMLDVQGQQKPDMKQVHRSAVSGIVLSGLMRVGLFVAVFGVMATGFVPDATNPAASIFKQAMGTLGEKMFGFILWCAAITSVVGASYTSVSFLESWHPVVSKYRQWWIAAFIGLSTVAFLAFGQPIKILVAAGAINGLVLPFSLTLVLLAVSNKRLLPAYKHPIWLAIAGWLATVLLAYMSVRLLADL